MSRQKQNSPEHPQTVISNLRSEKSNLQSAICNLQFLLLIAIATLLNPAHISGQGAPAQFVIYGQVRLPDGSPAGRAVVKIERPGGMSRQALTDDSGRYEVTDLNRGRYFVTAVNPADPDQFSDPVDAETGRQPGLRIQANVYLRYRTKVVSPKESQGGTITVVEQTQQVPKAAQKSFDQALRLRNEKQFEKALKSFERSIELFPEYFQAFSERGHLRIAMENPAEAAKDFDQALKINPGYGPALRGAGMCEFQQGKFAEAARDLEKAVDAEPSNAMAFLFLGVANLALDRRDQARASLKKALTIDPAGAARAHVHLANLWIKENRPAEAVAEIDAYLAVASDAPDAGKLRAIAAQLRSNIPTP